jgi:hypothetical protein
MPTSRPRLPATLILAAVLGLAVVGSALVVSTSPAGRSGSSLRATVPTDPTDWLSTPSAAELRVVPDARTTTTPSTLALAAAVVALLIGLLVLAEPTPPPSDVTGRSTTPSRAPPPGRTSLLR